MEGRIVGSPLFTAVLLASLSLGAAGQEDSSPEMPESFNEPMLLTAAFGRAASGGLLNRPLLWTPS